MGESQIHPLYLYQLLRCVSLVDASLRPRYSQSPPTMIETDLVPSPFPSSLLLTNTKDVTKVGLQPESGVLRDSLHNTEVRISLTSSLKTLTNPLTYLLTEVTSLTLSLFFIERTPVP